MCIEKILDDAAEIGEAQQRALASVMSRLEPLPISKNLHIVQNPEARLHGNV